MTKKIRVRYSFFRWPWLIILVVALSACTSVPVEESKYVQIQGEFFYKERIALKPGDYAYISLEDISKMDAPSIVIDSHKISLDGMQVPIPYQLKVASNQLDTRHVYSLRVQIRNAEDNLEWTSDTANPVDPELYVQTMDPIRLVRVTKDVSTVNPLLNTAWRVEDINRAGVIDRSMTTLEFASDGVLAGTAGCNRYTTQYKVNDDQIDVGIVRVTQRACIPGLANQEIAFLNVLEQAQQFKLDTKRGLLKIMGKDGSQILASRKN